MNEEKNDSYHEMPTTESPPFDDLYYCITPNLYSLLGKAVAEKIISTAGDVLKLAKIPVGHFRRSPSEEIPGGMPSEAAHQVYVGLLHQTELFDSTPDDPLKTRGCRKFAVMSIYAARVDFLKLDPFGNTGRIFRAKVQQKIEKWTQSSSPVESSSSKHKEKKGPRLKDSKFMRILSDCKIDGPEFIGPAFGKIPLVSSCDGPSLSKKPRPDELSLSENVLQHNKDVYQGISSRKKTPNPNFDDLDSVSKLQNTRHFTDILQKVEEALQKGFDALNQGMEDNPERQLIADCGALGIKVEDEIVILHYFICEKYRVKFPELASLVLDPIDYARVVKKIGNATDLTLVALEDLLRPAVISTVYGAASTTSGKPLLEENLKMTIAACDRLLALDLARKKVLEFLEGRMVYVAPNVSALVGPADAAKMIWTASGVSELARLPFGFLHLRPERETLVNTTPQAGSSLLDQTKIVASTPDVFKRRVSDTLGSKVLHAARVDSKRGDPTWKAGRTFGGKIRKKIEKCEELPQSIRPEGVPDFDMSKTKRMRDGRRFTDSNMLAFLSKIKIPHYSEDYLDRREREAKQAFDADEVMSALSVIFKSPPAHSLNRIHPHPYSRWVKRKHVIPVD